MIKLTFCLVRRPDFTRAEFQRYWCEEHAPKVKAASKALGIVRYVQSHTYSSPAGDAVASARGMEIAGGAHEYDGVAELWWESEDSFANAAQTKEGRRHGAILLADEARFIDLPRSRIFLTRENVVIE